MATAMIGASATVPTHTCIIFRQASHLDYLLCTFCRSLPFYSLETVKTLPLWGCTYIFTLRKSCLLSLHPQSLRYGRQGSLASLAVCNYPGHSIPVFLAGFCIFAGSSLGISHIPASVLEPISLGHSYDYHCKSTKSRYNVCVDWSSPQFDADIFRIPESHYTYSIEPHSRPGCDVVSSRNAIDRVSAFIVVSCDLEPKSLLGRPRLIASPFPSGSRIKLDPKPIQ